MVLLSLSKCLESSGPSSHHISRFNWDHGTVGVGNKATIRPEASGVGRASSNDSTSSGKLSLGSGNLGSVSRDNSTVGVGDQGAGCVWVGACIWVGDCGHHGAVGVGHQLGSRDGDTGSENLLVLKKSSVISMKERSRPVVILLLLLHGLLWPPVLRNILAD